MKDDEVLKEISTNIVQLVTYYNNRSDKESLKFVISTISDPKEIVLNKSKACDYFQYICCDSWDEYFSQLFDVLCDSLNLNLGDLKSLIIESSNNSPRILKYIFKKIVVSGDTSESSVNKAIKISLKEIVG